MHLLADIYVFHGAAGRIRARHMLVFYVDMCYSTQIVLNVCILVLVANTAEYCMLVEIVSACDCLIRCYWPMYKDCIGL